MEPVASFFLKEILVSLATIEQGETQKCRGVQSRSIASNDSLTEPSTTKKQLSSSTNINKVGVYYLCYLYYCTTSTTICTTCATCS